jgi:hypothetical protein
MNENECTPNDELVTNALTIDDACLNRRVSCFLRGTNPVPEP